MHTNSKLDTLSLEDTVRIEQRPIHRREVVVEGELDITAHLHSFIVIGYFM